MQKKVKQRSGYIWKQSVSVSRNARVTTGMMLEGKLRFLERDGSLEKCRQHNMMAAFQGYRMPLPATMHK